MFFFLVRGLRGETQGQPFRLNFTPNVVAIGCRRQVPWCGKCCRERGGVPVSPSAVIHQFASASLAAKKSFFAHLDPCATSPDARLVPMCHPLAYSYGPLSPMCHIPTPAKTRAKPNALIVLRNALQQASKY